MEVSTPIARALRCLQLLQETPGITADQLGDRLGVSSRAARRYVTMLRSAEIPIESSSGPYGGYRIGRGVRLPPLTFSVAEAVALVMAALDAAHPAADPDDPVGSALGKLLRSLPRPIAAPADALRRLTHSAPDRAAARPDPTTTMVLVQACAERRRVRLTYQPETGMVRVFEVDPWFVVVRHGRWYLLSENHPQQTRRVHRIDRVIKVETMDDTASAPPPDLDPIGYLEEHLATGWDYDVEVVIEAPLDTVAWLPRTLGWLDAIDADTTRLTGSTSNPYWYAEQLITLLPAPFRVVRDHHLQETTRQLGHRLLAAAGP